MTDALIHAFCADQRSWLALELTEDDQRKGRQDDTRNSNNVVGYLSRLEVREVSVGLFGRTVVRLGPMVSSSPTNNNHQNGLVHSASPATTDEAEDATATSTQTTSLDKIMVMPAHRFTTGDEVEIESKQHNQQKQKHHRWAGVVCEVTDEMIAVALFGGGNDRASTTRASGKSTTLSSNNTKTKGGNDSDDDEDANRALWDVQPPLALRARGSLEVYRKLIATLDELEQHGIGHPVAGSVIQAAFEVNSILFTTKSVTQNTTASSAVSSQNTVTTHEVLANDISQESCRDVQQPINKGLDASQLEAIDFCLTSGLPISLLHGPPGSGKTTTVVELIQKAIYEHGHRKILVTAPSNVAVDNVLVRLVQANALLATTGSNLRRSTKKTPAKSSSGSQDQSQVQHHPHRRGPIRVVRLGHPARLQASIVPFSLEAQVQAAEGTEIVADVRRELQGFLKIVSRSSSRATDKRVAFREIKSLRSEIRKREQRVVETLLADAHVILATCVGAANDRLLKDIEFDLVVIDEAAQALEAACWIPALRGKRLILAGDHCQLPPTVQSHLPHVQKGLGRTMFERVMELYGDHSSETNEMNQPQKQSTAPPQLGRVSRMLQVQYRMNERIADWASQALYHGALTSHYSVRHRTLAQLTGQIDDDGVAEMPLLLIDTAGCDMYESVNTAGSRYNLGEAEVVARHVRALLELGVGQEQIAVITPYNGQVEVLRSALLPHAPKLEIRSVDGFQGGEREAVVLSLVRSSERGGKDGIGFLRDDRRLNVAVTRAKRHCCVVCDSETVAQSSFVQNLLEWIQQYGEQRSAFEYLADDHHVQQHSHYAVVDNRSHLKRSNNLSKSKNEEAKPANSKDEQRINALLLLIREFASNGEPGKSLHLSKELDKYDRKFVHELAEELGLGHLSSGTEGIDRRITISIPLISADLSHETTTARTGDQAKVSSLTEAEPITESTPTNADLKSEDVVLVSHNGRPHIPFEVLQDAEDDATIEMKKSFEESATEEFRAFSGTLEDQEQATGGNMNAILTSLAKERANRRCHQPEAKAQQLQTRTMHKAASKKGRKLGVAAKSTVVKKDDSLDELDDLSFLDAQIIKNRESHGVALSATGSNYRTIMSGILLAKPADVKKKPDARASAALHSKLKQAQADRKAKSKK